MTFHDDDGSPARDAGEERRRRTSDAAGTPPIHVIVLRQVADALNVDPVELPPLNSVIDPDALCVLARTTRWGSRGWPSVSFRYVDFAVRITGPTTVTLEPVDEATSTSGGADDRTHVTPVSDPPPRSTAELETRLVTALAERTDREPNAVREAVDAAVDRAAIARLSRPRANGVARTGATVRFAVLGRDVVVGPDGSIAIGPTLERLRTTGSNVLLVGSVPEDVTDHASVQFLGSSDPNLRRLVALLDRSLGAAADRLAAVGHDAETTRVIDRGAVARSAAGAVDSAVDEGGSAVDPPSLDADRGAGERRLDDVPAVEVETATGDLEAFVGAVETTLDELAEDSPVDLRLCVDSLRPLVETDDAETARAVLEPVCERVTDASGIGHYVFPVDRETAAVRSLEPLFDATVELDVRPGGPAQRWHLHGGTYATEWYPLRSP